MSFIPSPETAAYPDPFVEAAVGDQELMGFLYDAALTGFQIAIVRDYSQARNRPIRADKLIQEEQQFLTAAHSRELDLLDYWREANRNPEEFELVTSMRDWQRAAETAETDEARIEATRNYLDAKDDLNEFKFGDNG